MSGMIDLLFYMFLVAPVTKNLYTKKGMIYAIGFLTVIGLGQVYVQHIHYAEPNVYRTLQVVRASTTSEIKRAYRKVALKYHPDKVAHLGKEIQRTAEEKFKAVSDAFSEIKKQRNIS